MNRALLTSLLLALPAFADEDKAGPNDNKPPEGFTALFDGKDLTNWKGVVPMNQRKGTQAEIEAKQKAADAKVLPHWTVVDGILTYDGKGDSLQSAKDYGDFELRVSWKIQENGDSGIYIRGQPQVQIWDSDNSPGARGEDKHSGSGGLWNNPPQAGKTSKDIGKMPLEKADKPLGEWNTFRIIMKGDNATVYLNDKLVVDNKPLANYWEKGKPLPATGPIELQHHGDKLWFKNIYVKELK
jgi:hypothetical protein